MGINPMMLVQQFLGKNPNAQNNPMISNAMNMANANDVNGLKRMAENICRQRGLNLEDVQNQVAQRFRKM